MLDPARGLWLHDAVLPYIGRLACRDHDGVESRGRGSKNSLADSARYL